MKSFVGVPNYAACGLTHSNKSRLSHGWSRPVSSKPLFADNREQTPFASQHVGGTGCAPSLAPDQVKAGILAACVKMGCQEILFCFF